MWRNDSDSDNSLCGVVRLTRNSQTFFPIVRIGIVPLLCWCSWCWWCHDCYNSIVVVAVVHFLFSCLFVVVTQKNHRKLAGKRETSIWQGFSWSHLHPGCPLFVRGSICYVQNFQRNFPVTFSERSVDSAVFVGGFYCRVSSRYVVWFYPSPLYLSMILLLSPLPHSDLPILPSPSHSFTPSFSLSLSPQTVRSIYFFLLPAGVNSIVRDYVLVALPTFLYFTAFSLVVVVW